MHVIRGSDSYYFIRLGLSNAAKSDALYRHSEQKGAVSCAHTICAL